MNMFQRTVLMAAGTALAAAPALTHAAAAEAENAPRQHAASQSAAVAPAASRAVRTCGRNWPHYRYGSGNTAWGYTEFKICWDNSNHARIDYDRSYVRDKRNDHKEVRVYLQEWDLSVTGWHHVWYGPLATAGYSSGKVHYYAGDKNTRGWTIVMCNGRKAPWDHGHVCTRDL